jgi:hypothetical protein
LSHHKDDIAGYPFMAKGVAVTGLARGYAAHLDPFGVRKRYDA